MSAGVERTRDLLLGAAGAGERRSQLDRRTRLAAAAGRSHILRTLLLLRTNETVRCQ
jgi:hypothetical protein